MKNSIVSTLSLCMLLAGSGTACKRFSRRHTRAVHTQPAPPVQTTPVLVQEPIPVQAHELAEAAERARAESFLAFYNGVITELSARTQEHVWAASTDVTDKHMSARAAAESVFAGFSGSKYVVETSRQLMQLASIDDTTKRQLQFVLLDAAYAPGSDPQLAKERIEAEVKQSEMLDGYTYCLEPGPTPEAPCAKPLSANDINQLLRDERDMAKRIAVWNASKALGDKLRDGLLRLRDLRNRVAKVMGYTDFFALQVADYGMTSPELMSILDTSLAQLKPLFTKLHCWARKKLSTRYNLAAQGAPIAAHWLGNRWAQSWPGLVEAAELDSYFKGKDGPFIVKTAENYYVSMGFSPLPQSFWDRSDLYQLPPDSTRKKNAHASAWHIDLDQDVRSLMSVVPNSEWFETAHHELGHIYYYQSYTRPEVPPVLRRGLNRAFHEAMGDLIAKSVIQQPYLRKLGLLPATTTLDANAMLLNEALDKGPVFFMFAAGTMSHFEQEFYSGVITPEQLNARWWNLVREYQGVIPPSTRDESHCDACTKTHINDDPAQYYDYALATLLVYQLHEHLCRTYVHADPHECTYADNREVGDALRKILSLGATKDWRTVLKETTGQDLSAQAMLNYFSPLQEMLDRETAGEQCGW